MRSCGGSLDPNDVPSIVEIFSNTVRAWFVGLVVDNSSGTLTIRFVDGDGERKEKNIHCEDPRVAYFGTKTGWAAPPGVVAVPSATRAGQFSYLDQQAMQKYATPELAWQAYLERHVLDVDLGGQLPPVMPAPKPVPASPDRAQNSPAHDYALASKSPAGYPSLPAQPRVVDDSELPKRSLDFGSAPAMPDVPASWQLAAGLGNASVAVSRVMSQDVPDFEAELPAMPPAGQSHAAAYSRVVSRDSPEGFELPDSVPPWAPKAQAASACPYPPALPETSFAESGHQDETMTSFVCRGFNGESADSEGVRVVIEGCPPAALQRDILAEGPMIAPRGAEQHLADGVGPRSLNARPALGAQQFSTRPVAQCPQRAGAAVAAAKVVSAPPWAKTASQSSSSRPAADVSSGFAAAKSPEVVHRQLAPSCSGAGEKVALPSFSGAKSGTSGGSQNAYLESLGVQAGAGSDAARARLAGLAEARRQVAPSSVAQESRGRGLVGHHITASLPQGGYNGPLSAGQGKQPGAGSWGHDDIGSATMDHLPWENPPERLPPRSAAERLPPHAGGDFQADLAQELAEARRTAVEAVQQRRATAEPALPWWQQRPGEQFTAGPGRPTGSGPEMLLQRPPPSSGSESLRQWA
eukprot:TRINITY_DN40135_c0_g1_i1.p1 TRINITY_DN40135_c0_g1~~TRINITY_DN40135_c0_g1_i1.p1  ORF type:complete len:637 (+),score=133.18 TRINITY_DN40135_c0_g1_i1:57-1967(+)